MNKVFYFLFNLFLEARAEIHKTILLVFWSKRGQQSDILMLTDRQKKKEYPYFYSKCTKSHMKGLKNSPFDVGGIPKEVIQGLNAGIRVQITESHFDF
jgi:hypothetical protein